MSAERSSFRNALGRAHMLARFSACVAVAIPNTIFPPLPLTMLLTRRFGREDRLKRLHRMISWARRCRRDILKVKLQVSGRENIPVDRRGYMFVSNHQSYVDILVLMEALDTVAFLSKKLVQYIPLIGQHSYAAGTIYFQRRDKQSRQQALDETLRMCRQSTAVVVFPEGTRSEDGQLRPKIYPGAIEGAYRQGLRAIPVGLDGTLDIVPKSMDRVNLGRAVAVTIGPPIVPNDCASAEQFVQRVWGEVGRLFEDSRRQLKT